MRVALIGRGRELAAMHSALSNAISTGTNSVLVVRGDPGVGKTALIDTFAAQVGDDARVLRTEGVESESDLGYAALHRLLRPLMSGAVDLADPQRTALETAFGVLGGPTPERFLVGLAGLSLIAEAAVEHPLVVLVDDVQWLDRESRDALTFLARRLQYDRVALILAVRAADRAVDFDGFPTIEVEGVGERSVLKLLDMALGHSVDPAVARRVAQETAGNPLAVLELADLGRDDLQRWVVQPNPLPVGARVEARFGARIRALPADTQTVLLVAAADERIDHDVLQRVCAALDVSASAAEPAEAAGLVTYLDGRLTFRHSLVRSACYSTAPAIDRRCVHRAIANELDPSHEVERRAWHLSLGTVSTDDAVADALVDAARRAGARGAHTSQVELLGRAAELTSDRERRAHRYLRAGGAATLIGAHERVGHLVALARDATRDRGLAAQANHVEALLPTFDNRWEQVPRALLDVASTMDEFDRPRARAVGLEAVFMLGVARHRARGVDHRSMAEWIRTVPAPSGIPATAIDLLLDGYASLIIDGFAVGAPMMRAGLDQWPTEAATSQSVHRHMGPPIWIGFELWDGDATRRAIDHVVATTRAADALRPLMAALVYRTRFQIGMGQLGAAEETAAEVANYFGMMHEDFLWAPLVSTELAAWRGDVDGLQSGVNQIRELSEQRGHGTAEYVAQLAIAVHANSTRQHEAAAHAARSVLHDPISSSTSQALAELAEALAKLNDPDANDVVDQLEARAGVSGTHQARSIAARTRALIADDDDADDLYRDAIALAETTSAASDLARSHLLYGEWLRRRQRRVDAREHLRAAHHGFTTMEAATYARRAEAELEATGEHIPRRHDGPSEPLTPQERQIAKLAQTGATNKEIAAELYLSATTIDYHLRKVFRKLGITSRRQLRGQSLT